MTPDEIFCLCIYFSAIIHYSTHLDPNFQYQLLENLSTYFQRYSEKFKNRDLMCKEFKDTITNYELIKTDMDIFENDIFVQNFMLAKTFSLKPLLLYDPNL
mmetsp:Transcript_14990/g.10880  ORF Transcript_14990/g.10880 Transcript_14990/m.10880 type:complete len:101 (+) Transcript_14990:1115-1417(+)